MKVNATQYLFAYNIPGKLCYLGFPTAILLISLWTSEISLRGLTGLTEPRTVVFVVFVLIVSIPLGLLLAMLCICFFLTPFYFAVEEMNGGPFKPGDRVYVISGVHKGMTTKVYSDWQGFAVRIRIGEEEEETFKDICSPVNLIKTEAVEPPAATDGEYAAARP